MTDHPKKNESRVVDLQEMAKLGFCWRYYCTSEEVARINEQDPTWFLRTLIDLETSGQSDPEA
jgi:hypothetical protein